MKNILAVIKRNNADENKLLRLEYRAQFVPRYAGVGLWFTGIVHERTGTLFQMTSDRDYATSVRKLDKACKLLP